MKFDDSVTHTFRISCTNFLDLCLFGVYYTFSGVYFSVLPCCNSQLNCSRFGLSQWNSVNISEVAAILTGIKWTYYPFYSLFPTKIKPLFEFCWWLEFCSFGADWTCVYVCVVVRQHQVRCHREWQSSLVISQPQWCRILRISIHTCSVIASLQRWCCWDMLCCLQQWAPYEVKTDDALFQWMHSVRTTTW